MLFKNLSLLLVTLLVWQLLLLLLLLLLVQQLVPHRHREINWKDIRYKMDIAIITSDIRPV